MAEREEREHRSGRRGGWAAGAAARVWLYRRYWSRDLWIAAALVLAGILLSLGTVDLAIARRFYAASAPGVRWPLGERAPWSWLYHLAELIAVLVPAGCLARLLAPGAGRRHLRRVHCVYLLLALLLGAGLVVNGVLKSNWGRPRPRHVEAFGGWRPYQPALVPGVRGRGQSFPSGHSSAGYYLTAFYFLFRRRPRAAAPALAVAMVAGTAIGFSRMAAGAHFASDVAWSAAIVFGVNLVLYYFLINVPAYEDGLAVPLTVRGRRWPCVAGVGLLIALAFFGVTAAAPIHKDMRFETGDLLTERGPGVLRISAEACDLDLRLAREWIFRVEGEAFGSGFPGSSYEAEMLCRDIGDTRTVDFRCWPRGWFSRIDAHALITVPLDSAAVLMLDLRDASARVAPGSTFPGDLVLRVERGVLTLPESWRGAPLRIEGAGRIEYSEPEPQGTL